MGELNVMWEFDFKDANDDEGSLQENFTKKKSQFIINSQKRLRDLKLNSQQRLKKGEFQIKKHGDHTAAKPFRFRQKVILPKKLRSDINVLSKNYRNRMNEYRDKVLCRNRLKLSKKIM